MFQEPLVTGKNCVRGEKNDPIVDLRHLDSFEENFFLVSLEKNTNKTSTLHMWMMTIASSSLGRGASTESMNILLFPFDERKTVTHYLK